MKSKFGSLKRKLFVRVLLSALLIGIVGFLLVNWLVDGVLQNPFADWFISAMRGLGANDDFAHIIYAKLFRQNKEFYLMVGYVLLLLTVFYFSLSRITRYLNRINSAMDQVLIEDERPISLPSELSPVEDKLNEVKDTLRRKKLETKEAEQRKNDLVVYLAHDLKTPLTSVIGYLSLLSEAPDMPAKQRAKYTGIALDKAYRLEELTNEFFDITRFNLQSINLEPRRIDLTLLLSQLVDEFYPLLSPKALTGRLSAEPNLMVRGDADKLARVFDNVIRNAINYSDENSEILVTATRRENWAVVTVSNQGDPIPAHKLDKIFEKFYRLDEARSSKSGGSGLGLAIAKQIVELHGGRISVQSDAESTRFSILIPYDTVRNS